MYNSHLLKSLNTKQQLIKLYNSFFFVWKNYMEDVFICIYERSKVTMNYLGWGSNLFCVFLCCLNFLVRKKVELKGVGDKLLSGIGVEKCSFHQNIDDLHTFRKDHFTGLLLCLHRIDPHSIQQCIRPQLSNSQDKFNWIIGKRNSIIEWKDWRYKRVN